MITALGTGDRQRGLRCGQAALWKNHPHDRCRRGWLPHSHAVAHVLLPPHGRTDQARHIARAEAMVVAMVKALRVWTALPLRSL